MIRLLTSEGQFMDWGDRKLDSLPDNLVYLDLHNPTRTEEVKSELWLDHQLPAREEMEEIEESSRLYEEGDALYMTVVVPTGLDSAAPDMSPIAFVLSPHTLTTVRHSDPSAWRTFPDHVRRQCGTHPTSDAVFLALVGRVIARIADALQAVETDLRKVSQDIFRADAPKAGGVIPVDLNEVVRLLGRRNSLVADLRECLASIARMIAFCLNHSASWMKGDLAGPFRSVARDVKSLDDYTNQQTQEMTFLLESTLGLINIQQNQIVKIFTIAGVIFMPPTLIASIYGMNFEHMPELVRRWAYPAVLVLMVFAAILPIYYITAKKML